MLHILPTYSGIIFEAIAMIPIKQPVFQWKVSEGFFHGSNDLPSLKQSPQVRPWKWFRLEDEISLGDGLFSGAINPNKYRLYKVCMGLIIKGTIPRVPPFSPWFQGVLLAFHHDPWIHRSSIARFPGYLSKFLDVKFSEVPNGLSAFSKALWAEGQIWLNRWRVRNS